MARKQTRKQRLRAARKRRQRLRAAKRLKAKPKPKATDQDIDKLEETVTEGITESLPFVSVPKLTMPQYTGEGSGGGMNYYTKDMSPENMQKYSAGRYAGGKGEGRKMRTGSFKVKDVEKKRMKHLLGTRSEDEAAMLQFQKLRKDLKIPKKVNYGPSDAFDDLYESGMSYAYTAPETDPIVGLIEDPDTYKIRRSDVYYPGREADLMAHEVGHVMEGSDMNKSEPHLPVNIQRRLHLENPNGRDPKLQKILDGVFKAPLQDRVERNQRLYGPIKMAISNVHGTVPVNRAEFEVMRDSLNNPAKKQRIIDNALVITVPSGLKEYKPMFERVFRGILEDAYEDILKGKGEGYDDFMTYSKANKGPQSSRQIAASKMSSKQDKA